MVWAGVMLLVFGAVIWASGPMNGDVSRAVWGRHAVGWGKRKGERGPLVVIPALVTFAAGLIILWVALLDQVIS